MIMISHRIPFELGDYVNAFTNNGNLKRKKYPNLKRVCDQSLVFDTFGEWGSKRRGKWEPTFSKTRKKNCGE